MKKGGAKVLLPFFYYLSSFRTKKEAVLQQPRKITQPETSPAGTQEK